MDRRRELEKKIDDNWDRQLKVLKELIAIRSVVSVAEEDFPFGGGVQEAFGYVLDLGQDLGFETFNADNYGGHVEMGGTGMETLGIACHLDTVPEGDDWDYPPFGGEIVQDRLYGRGAIDNKGPAVAVLFAMKALKDLGKAPEKKVRLILGLDEETNWDGMEYYLGRTEQPDLGFTPDAEFPAINGEKGILVLDLAKKFQKSHEKGLELKSIKGGSAPNMVPDYARALIQSETPEIYEKIKKRVEELKESGKMDIRGRVLGKSFELVVKGVSSHGARPDLGINAISLLLSFLAELNFAGDDVNDFLEFYREHIGTETDGRSLGCRLEDKPSGTTVVNVGLIEADTKAAGITINVRYPVTASSEDIYSSLEPVCNKYNLGIIKGKKQDPIYIPGEDPFIETLMDVYREHTGDEVSRPKVIGGGTYARAFKNMVAFGSSFPGEADVAHQKNEFIDLKRLRTMTAIYADAIYRLSGMK